jgi:hypothetical protein
MLHVLSGAVAEWLKNGPRPTLRPVEARPPLTVRGESPAW